MNVLEDRTQEELAAMARLAMTPDFQVFMTWLDRSLARVKHTAVYEESDASVRWSQGRAQALHEIKTAVATTRTVMGRTR